MGLERPGGREHSAVTSAAGTLLHGSQDTGGSGVVCPRTVSGGQGPWEHRAPQPRPAEDTELADGETGLQRPDSRPEVGTKHVENVAELVCTASAPTLLFNAIEPQVCKHTPPVPACRGDLSHERVESTPKDLQRRWRRRWRVSLQGPSKHASDLVSGAPVALTGLYVQQGLITSRGLLYQIIPVGQRVFETPTGQFAVCGGMFGCQLLLMRRRHAADSSALTRSQETHAVSYGSRNIIVFYRKSPWGVSQHWVRKVALS